MRDNQIVGYGLVTGLQGTGDTLRNAQFTEQSLQSMLDRMGINVRDARLRTRNVAAVMVTADLPPYVGAGSRIDVTVTSLGDATSLRGGTLLMTPLSGGDGNVYAAAQGPLAVSGFSAQGQAEQLTQGVPTAGRIPNGALIEREVPGAFRDLPELIFELKNPTSRPPRWWPTPSTPTRSAASAAASPARATSARWCSSAPATWSCRASSPRSAT